MIDAVAGVIRKRLASGQQPVVVTIAGSVAVGKSTFAAALAASLDDLGVAVVATDCFLLANEELAMRGLIMQKGFPHSYDDSAIADFLTAIRTSGSAQVPVYSHTTYDRVEGETAVIGPADVVIVEGVNALQPALAEGSDVRVFIEAEEPDVRRWFVDRFMELCVAAEKDEASFYVRFVALPEDQRRAIAEATWEGINLVNLQHHIAPTRASADMVLYKDGSHAITLVD